MSGHSRVTGGTGGRKPPTFTLTLRVAFIMECATFALVIAMEILHR